MYKIPLETISEEITKAFEYLEFTPRDFQVPIIFDVLNAFLNDGKRVVVLSAGTGSGKSIMGAVVSRVIDVLTPEDQNLPSIISMGQNILAKQYAASFTPLGKYKFFQIKGASNYSCKFMEAQPIAHTKTAEECVKANLIDMEKDKYCKGCEYDEAKGMVHVTENLITNYSYFLTSELVSNHLKPRKLHIFDEAHTLNDIFCSFTEITVSVELIDKYIKELSDTNGKCDNEIAGLVMLKGKLSSGSIGHNNYMACVSILMEIYKSIIKVLSAQAASLVKVDIVKSSKFSKMASKYDALKGRISALIENKYDHVFDDTVENTFTIKTIFVSDETKKLLARFTLLMSATITEQFVYDTLNLSRDEVCFMDTEPVFPPENKPLFFIGKNTLNYASLKDPEIIEGLKKQVSLIVAHHSGQKGLLLVPSFYLGSQLVYNLKGTKVFEHKSGVKLADLIEEFKQYKGSCFLVSPSIYEGLDVTESSYQIISKTPYASLGDKRIKYIADNYPNIYKEMALIKIIQGIGRSVRSPTDTAATYFLDPSSKKLYDSKFNLWKSHCKVISK